MVFVFFKNIFDEEIINMFKEFDVDGDGEFDVDEFILCINNMLKEVFDFCDIDGVGKVIVSEFYVVMIGFGEDFIEEKCVEMV